MRFRRYLCDGSRETRRQHPEVRRLRITTLLRTLTTTNPHSTQDRARLTGCAPVDGRSACQFLRRIGWEGGGLLAAQQLRGTQVLARFLVAQLELAAEMCFRRQMICIEHLQRLYGPELLLCGFLDAGRLPPGVRGAFAKLLQSLWVDRPLRCALCCCCSSPAGAQGKILLDLEIQLSDVDLSRVSLAGDPAEVGPSYIQQTLVATARLAHGETAILAVNGFATQFGFYQRAIMSFVAHASLTRQLTTVERAALGGGDDWGLTPVNAISGVTMRLTQDHRILMRQRFRDCVSGASELDRKRRLSMLHRAEEAKRRVLEEEAARAIQRRQRVCVSRSYARTRMAAISVVVLAAADLMAQARKEALP